MRNRIYNAPTCRQLAALQVLAEWMAKRKLAPTQPELAEAMGLASKSGAHYYVLALARIGLVTFQKTEVGHAAARTLRVTNKGRRLLELRRELVAAAQVRGERALVLRKREQAAVQRIKPRFGGYRLQDEGEARVLEFVSRAERDFWLRVLLSEMAEGDG